MQKTGESYTSARAQIMRKQLAHEPNRAQPERYAELAGTADETIAAKTGRTWAEWVRELDGRNAGGLTHREIAALIHGEYGVDGWWSQSVTVGYERIKGLRAVGQRRTGEFEAGKSRTFGVPVEALFEAWENDATRGRWLSEDGMVVRTATAPKTMRLGWPDGTIVALWFLDKGAGKSSVALQHQKLPDKAASERAKQEWSERLDALSKVLAEDV
jgi:hypothetical protein